ncbi:MAG: PIN domain-containing protein [Emergencia sp.]|nr:PIN domain-containing protein [Emergencia sp.]
MKILIDTNVILDHLTSRKPFDRDAADIFKLCETQQIKGYISALSVPNIVYILRKELDAVKIKKIIQILSLIFTIKELTTADLIAAADMNFKDYEDALQSVAAAKIKADYIVTRNIKDFINSPVPAITPTEFLLN